jgi:hypothetical protein
MKIIGSAEFAGFECDVIQSEYQKDNSVAILLQEKETGDDVATASVWIPGLQQGEVAIKDYSENEGMLDVMITAGIVSQPIRHEESGFAIIPVCKFLK